MLKSRARWAHSIPPQGPDAPVIDGCAKERCRVPNWQLKTTILSASNSCESRPRTSWFWNDRSEVSNTQSRIQFAALASALPLNSTATRSDGPTLVVNFWHENRLIGGPLNEIKKNCVDNLGSPPVSKFDQVEMAPHIRRPVLPDMRRNPVVRSRDWVAMNGPIERVHGKTPRQTLLRRAPQESGLLRIPSFRRPSLMC